MAQDTSNWEDDTLPPAPADWLPVQAALEHTLRLMILRSTVDALLSVTRAKQTGKSTLRKWAGSIQYCLESWCRITGEDPHQGYDAVNIDLAMDVYAHALRQRQIVIEEGTTAVTWALRAGHRRDANRMSFYLDREIQDLERIFGIM